MLRVITRNYARNITRNYAHFYTARKGIYLIFITPDQLNPLTRQQAGKVRAWQRLYWTQASKNKAVIRHSFTHSFWTKNGQNVKIYDKNIGTAVLISYIDTTTAMIMTHEDDDTMAAK